ncbi:MAG: PepSY-like domain-containing protein [Bacteroidota bacterium]|nr:PepSY-like domain-containing protein [Bacteroidota bacterium]
MKSVLAILLSSTFFSLALTAQTRHEGNSHAISVPHIVRIALYKNFPESKTYHIVWERENGNYEANWGGRDGEANSAQFNPQGDFIEIVKEISSSQLPKSIFPYLKAHYHYYRLGGLGIVKDAKGITTYEVEVHGKDIIFDQSGKFLKEEK